MAEKDNTKEANEINARIILVDSFLVGEENDYIQYLLDEGLRERALDQLKIRDKVTEDGKLLARDTANFLTVEVPEPDTTLEEKDATLADIDRRWSSTTGLNYKLSRKLTESSIDREITELI